MTIRPKPTLYKGIRFRSRLEARWAVFFDAIGREWVYEPTFRELAGLSYQPDFLMDGWGGEPVVVEVKPWPGPDPSDWGPLAPYINQIHASGGVARYEQVAGLLHTRVLLLMGVPGVWEQGRLTALGSMALSFSEDHGAVPLLEWAECDQCGRVALWPDGRAGCCRPLLPTGPLFRAFGRVRDESYEDAP